MEEETSHDAFMENLLNHPLMKNRKELEVLVGNVHLGGFWMDLTVQYEIAKQLKRIADHLTAE